MSIITEKPILTGRLIILCTIIFASNFLAADLFSPIIVLSGFSLLILSLGKIKISYLKYVKPLLVIFILGIIGLTGHESRHILRDISYALSPISLIFIGFWLADNKRMWPHILKILIFFGIIFSIIHLAQFILHPELLGEKIDDMRKKVSNPGGNLIILAFVLGLLQNRINLGNLFPKFLPRFIAIPLLFLSFFLSFSRTGLISLILLVFAILGFMGRINLRALFSFGLLIFGIIFIILTTPADEVGTFRSKIARSGKEIVVSDYENMNDINRNWRGFETYRALDTFMSGNLSQKILGQGFGALVDLGFTMTLGEVEYSKIPVLHNGYAYILVKTGLIGILCYVFFYYILIKQSFKFKNSIDQEHIFLSRLLLGITLSLIFSMIVVGGMAEIHDSEFVILAGYILRRIEQV